MSADNYHFVGKTKDGKFGIWPNRSASCYYRDEIDPDEWPQSEARFTGTGPVDEFGFAPIPEDWVDDGGEPWKVFDRAEDALVEAHHLEIADWTEYGVSIGEGVLP